MIKYYQLALRTFGKSAGRLPVLPRSLLVKCFVSSDGRIFERIIDSSPTANSADPLRTDVSVGSIIQMCEQKKENSLLNMIEAESSNMESEIIGCLFYHTGCHRIHIPTPYLKILTKRLDGTTDLWTGRTVGNILSCLKYYYDSIEIRELLNTINKNLNRNVNLQMNVMELTMSLNGIQGLRRSAEVLRLLTLLKTQVSKCPNNFSPRGITMSIFGLHRLPATDLEVREILSALREKLDSIPAHSVFVGRDIATCLCGLSEMNSAFPEPRQMLRSIRKKADANVNAIFKGIDAGMAVRGLRSMSSSCYEALEMLNTLRFIIERSNKVCKLGPQDIAMALYGLQGMSDASAEVLDFVRVFTATIEMNTDNCYMRGKDITMSCSSLRGMTSQTPEVKRLLTVLWKLIESSTVPLMSNDFCIALNGFQSMTASDEVRLLLEALRVKVLHDPQPIEALNFSLAIKGLQRMNAKHVEVRNILSFLVSKADFSERNVVVNGHTRYFDSKLFTMALFGLHRMDINIPEVQEALKLILDNSSIQAVRWMKMPLVDIHSACKFLSLSLEGLTGLDPKFRKALKDQRDQMLMHLNKNTKSLNVAKYFLPSEARVNRTVTNLLQKQASLKGCKVVSQSLILGFEADIYITRPNTQNLHRRESKLSANSILVNIEVENSFMDLPEKMLFQKYRDEFLLSNGVRTLRISKQNMIGLSEEKLEKLIWTDLAPYVD